MYKPTTEWLRWMYANAGRTDFYVPDDELGPRVDAFDRWLKHVLREARAEGWDRREDDLTSTLNPYRDEEP